jgi:nuclear pore complex protein Nup205
MTRLRDEGTRLAAVEAGAASLTLAVDPLLDLLKGTIQAITSSKSVGDVRGNMYVVLLNYLSYSLEVISAEKSSKSGDDNTLEDTPSYSPLTSQSALGNGNGSVLQSQITKLLPIICRDALVASDIWKTVAFTLLDSITLCFQRWNLATPLVHALEKQGYLHGFVRGLADSGSDLMLTLRESSGA